MVNKNYLNDKYQYELNIIMEPHEYNSHERFQDWADVMIDWIKDYEGVEMLNADVTILTRDVWTGLSSINKLNISLICSVKTHTQLEIDLRKTFIMKAMYSTQINKLPKQDVDSLDVLFGIANY